MKLRAVFGLILIAFLYTFSTQSDAASNQEDFKVITVFFARHAEKADQPKADPPLTEAGVTRSKALAQLLAASGVKTIFTSQLQRTKQTAEPLAKQLSIASTVVELKPNPANPRQIAVESITELTNKIMDHQGESVVVIGHTNSIPEVIKALGGDAVPTIDEKTFDDVFLVTVYARGKAKVTRLKYGS